MLDVPAGGGTVFVGTTRPVRRERVGRARRRPGDGRDARPAPSAHASTSATACVVPASTPHCIDAGVFVVELQEPTDFSVLLEWDGFDVDGPADGHLGLGFDVALDAVRTDAVERRRARRPRRGGRRRRTPRRPARRALLPDGGRPVLPGLGGRRRRRPRHRAGGVLGRRRHRGRRHPALGRTAAGRSRAATPSSSRTPPGR